MNLLNAIRAAWVRWVWRNTYTCTEMSRLASRYQDSHLPWGVRLRLRLHFSICIWCHRYFRQILFLRDAAGRYEQCLDATTKQALSAEARARLRHRLREAQPASDDCPGH